MGVAHLSTGFAEASGKGQSEVVTLGALPNITRPVLPDVVMAFKQIQPEEEAALNSSYIYQLYTDLRGQEKADIFNSQSWSIKNLHSNGIIDL